MAKEKKNQSFMMKLATFIVDKRKAIYLLFILMGIHCVIFFNATKINNDLTVYLNENTETRQGMDLMNKEFVTFGSARIMVCNITYEEAEKIAEQIGDMEGVCMVEFDDTEKHYHDMEALFTVMLEGGSNDARTYDYLKGILSSLEDYDVYFSSDVGLSEREADDLNKDMLKILIMAGCVIIAVLLFTSRTYAEIPIFLLIFGTASLINKGTNYWFDSVSFVTDSVAIVLQLALAVDYAIILCHRFMEEHETKDARDAVIVALSKAIPEISSSSLTTISGMVAMMFMQFRIGFDMGIVLAKAILISLITVFLLMPGILLTFSKAIDRTHHKNFVPKITAVGKFCVATRYILPPIFIVAVICGCVISSKTEYVYDQNSITFTKMSDNKYSVHMVNTEFGNVNQLAVLVPAGDYEKEAKLLGELAELDVVNSAMGLANVEAMDGYVLTEKLTAREFSELIDMDVEVAQLLYSAYAVNGSDFGAILEGVNSYEIPLLDMFLFVFEQKERGNITLEGELEDMLTEAYSMIDMARKQMQSENYSRMVLELNVPFEGEESNAALETIRETILKHYEETYLVGMSTNNRDLMEAFASDNNMITILTAVMVMIILLFTFKSAGLPVLLVLTIQGSIWINFSIPYLVDQPVFFLGYLVVSSIQMGATIDYAIVITSRYMALKHYMPVKQATIEALNQAFPTIVTSGTMMVSAGYIVGSVSTNVIIGELGAALGRGALTSILLVLLVLPQTLLLGDLLIEKTSFSLKMEMTKPLPQTGKIRVNGHVRGYVKGVIDGDFTGVIDGELGAVVRMKDSVETEGEAQTEEIDVSGDEAEENIVQERGEEDAKNNAENVEA